MKRFLLVAMMKVREVPCGQKDVFRVLLLAVLAVVMPDAVAQQGAVKGEASAERELELPSAMVVIDRRELVRVRGVTAFPAAERAAVIVARIEALAADPGFRADEFRTVETASFTDILARDRRVLVATGSDARLEGIGRRELAIVYVERTGRAIEEYPAARTREALTAGATRAAIATAALLAGLVLVFWVWRRMRTPWRQVEAMLKLAPIARRDSRRSPRS